jgi:hypothetical protein
MVRPEAQRLSSTVILPHRSLSEAVCAGGFGLSKQSPNRICDLLRNLSEH